jgi:hypothetical protein
VSKERNAALDALISGTIAGIATALVAAARGRTEARSAVAPLNAASHMVWGKRATWQKRPTLKYTGTGFVVHHMASVLWATVYERLFGRSDSRSIPKAVTHGALVSALAYLVDYHLVPKRFTPGFETRLSATSLALIYGVLALSLPLRALVEKGKRK